MSVVTRGVKNAFRNWLRTAAVVLILAIGIGLSLSMLVANQAVNAKISDLKARIGTTLTVNPAGSQGFEGGGEPLTNDNVTTVSKLAHVSRVTAAINFRLENQDANNGGIVRVFGGKDSGAAGKTNLLSAIDAGTLGKRFNSDASSDTPPPLPINGMGSTGGFDNAGTALNITSGRDITATETGYVAVVGKDLADKNNLHVGSTFTAYDQTFTVVGIFSQDSKFTDSGLIIPLSVAQTLSGQANNITHLLVKVDSADNVGAVQGAIKNALGSDKVDVMAAQETVQTAISSLQGVQQISIVAFVGALVAAAVIIFLIMLMVVRERKREIGVLKAIGGSNITIVSQFIVESLVLVVLGTIVGFGVTLLSSNSIANALVSSNVSNSNSNVDAGPGTQTGGGGRFLRLEGNGPNNLKNAGSLVGQVAANVGWMTVVYGALSALAIAVLGSAIPAWLISKVRPAEVMRGE